LWTLARYGLVGGVNTVAGVGVMVVLAGLGVHYALYTAAGYTVAFVTSYRLNARFTFRVEQVSQRGFALFAALNGGLLLLVEFFQSGMIELARMPELASVAAGAILYTLTGFVLNRRIVYRVA
jgi:putative flippase GtrA